MLPTELAADILEMAFNQAIMDFRILKTLILVRAEASTAWLSPGLLLHLRAAHCSNL